MQAPLRIARTLGLSMLSLATGCERLLSIHDPVADNGGGGADGGITDAQPGPRSPILLSEVVATPTEGEMIEIVNTSANDVDLSTYYLSDSRNYFRLPAQATVELNDFIAKFPDGTMIQGHQVFTIAVDTAVMFSTVYQKSPTFSISDPGSMKVIATNGPPTLTNDGEPIILFQWDGTSDLVHDVDIMIFGTPKSANLLSDKSGMLQDGPDPGTQPSRYAADVNTIAMHLQAVAPPAAPAGMPPISTQRIALEDGHELNDGNGNGPDGQDETSEDISVTWDGTTARPFGMATPGAVPPQLLR